MIFENQIEVNGKTIDIKPVKMKYIKNNFHGYYILVKQEKINLFNYTDGIDIFNKFMDAVFDGNKEIIDYLQDELDIETLENLLEKIQEVNKFPTDEELKK